MSLHPLVLCCWKKTPQSALEGQALSRFTLRFNYLTPNSEAEICWSFDKEYFTSAFKTNLILATCTLIQQKLGSFLWVRNEPCDLECSGFTLRAAGSSDALWSLAAQDSLCEQVGVSFSALVLFSILHLAFLSQKVNCYFTATVTQILCYIRFFIQTSLCVPSSCFLRYFIQHWKHTHKGQNSTLILLFFPKVNEPRFIFL